LKAMKILFFGVAAAASFGVGTNARADNLAAAAAKASVLVNRPIAGSPHGLEEFPWLLWGYSAQTEATESAQNTATYPDNLAAAAAKASVLVNRPVAASPHALEKFPSLLRGYSPQTKVNEKAQNIGTYPDNLAAAAAKASALVNRPIAASPHALEEFPWLLRGYSLQIGTKAISHSAGQNNRVETGVQEPALASQAKH